jgi:hypothetical protein
MKLSDLKRVKVGDKEYSVKITVRSMIDYEALTGESIVKFEGTDKLIKFFYCTAKAGAKSAGETFTYSYDEFLDAIDDFYTEAITNFSKAIFEPGVGDAKKKSPSST